MSERKPPTQAEPDPDRIDGGVQEPKGWFDWVNDIVPADTREFAFLLFFVVCILTLYLMAADPHVP